LKKREILEKPVTTWRSTPPKVCDSCWFMAMNCLWCFSDDKREPNLNDFDTSPAVFRGLIKSNAPISVFKKCSTIRHLIHSEIHNQFSPLESNLTFIRPPRKWFFVDLSLHMVFITMQSKKLSRVIIDQAPKGIQNERLSGSLLHQAI
jgi:hypothetical protein